MTEKRRRGFAVLPIAQRKAIASRGGKAAHDQGTAYEWTSEQARAAGRKGGLSKGRREMEKRLAARAGMALPIDVARR